jgi:pyruvyltransferase
VKLYWYDSNNNWGDHFTRYLLMKWFGREVDYAEPSQAEAFGAGSILESLPPGYTGNILGSGAMYRKTQLDLRTANVHALRGRLTQDRCLLSSTPVLGDPGLLAYLFAKPTPKTHSYGIIPHYTDKQHPQLADHPEALVIDIQSGVQNVIDQAASCERIVSSSLHGLVLADSLGIPNHWVILNGHLVGGTFKFEDYYSLYDEQPILVGNITEALRRVRIRETGCVKARLLEAIANA